MNEHSIWILSVFMTIFFVWWLVNTIQVALYLKQRDNEERDAIDYYLNIDGTIRRISRVSANSESGEMSCAEYVHEIDLLMHKAKRFYGLCFGMSDYAAIEPERTWTKTLPLFAAAPPVAHRVTPSLSSLAVGGGAAALLQIANPLVSAAVSMHQGGEFDREPGRRQSISSAAPNAKALYDPTARFQNTFNYLFRTIYGTFAEAERSARRIFAIHSRAAGKLRHEDVTPELGDLYEPVRMSPAEEAAAANPPPSMHPQATTRVPYHEGQRFLATQSSALYWVAAVLQYISIIAAELWRVVPFVRV
ncbi:hypothetical protein H696_03659 [Fonticula alba]|uniref:ER-bound oxygenase mpaB/mpaB'/Rubber oxygenase catalytic domain-containing protein n=1 Tax=Fonticula alba TaxID=691883 RepID=A0A058Z7V2_FONAL|nr:hypothetical protein H696_03659 [Fonticula alba]KCV70201.1 hypothetical protein H696_03659 [Fonticula alba]|eukprot:XP_009495807.1 hypothetical protein H696_03659 [Fonticula alba]